MAFLRNLARPTTLVALFEEFLRFHSRYRSRDLPLLLVTTMVYSRKAYISMCLFRLALLAAHRVLRARLAETSASAVLIVGPRQPQLQISVRSPYLCADLQLIEAKQSR